ncbi:MAG: FixH family protein [Pseudomonadota bacterium]
MIRELKGWHVLAAFIAFYAVIITVNLTLAFNAVGTFPGLEVKNSYVASQAFDRDREAQLALGWEIDLTTEGDELRLAISDARGPVAPDITRATLGRATHVGEDQEVVFHFDGTTHLGIIEPLGPGNWNLRLAAVAEDGTVFRQRIVLWVRR